MITIGKLKIEGSLVLAPMAGYSDSPFRRIARRYGAGLVFTELISADGIVRMNRKTVDLLRFTEEERPIGIQIFGNDPEIMAEAACKAEEFGPDLIDINMGCSVRRVVHSGSGSALLSDTDKLARITERIVKSVKLNTPISAKIRIGVDEKNKNYIEVIKILEDSGVSLISVHGRTRAQHFKGKADWDIIRNIKQTARVPIIGNGDILSYDEALARLKESGCDAVMIGRGAIGNPWIFSGQTPDINGLIEQIKLHINLMTDFYGDKGIVLMRKHISKYIKGLKNSSKIRGLIVTSKDKNEIFNYLQTLIV